MRLFLLISLLFRLLDSATAGQPYVAQWSKAYGPDGPWNTVKVALGTPPQWIDAIPAGQWTSWILKSDICKKALPQGTCFAQSAGTFNPEASDTFLDTSRIYTAQKDVFFEPSNFTFGDYKSALDTLTLAPGRQDLREVLVSNHTTFIVENAYRILPNGTRYSVTLSTLSLGGPDPFQNWMVNGVRTDGLLTSNDLAAQQVTESNSYSLHIGAAALKLGGSLLFGGYDRNRLIGPTSAQPFAIHTLPIALLDIGIGVALGSSPFAFNTRGGLLSEGNATMQGMTEFLVDIEGRDPYLYLPKSTCDALASKLPVQYTPDLGLYLWQVNDPLYKRIVHSPAYLAFTFRANNSAASNITVKVPFRLLTLTLSEPLAHESTQYFPCTTPIVPGYRLGRAFLQAAFISVNWMEDYRGVFMVAQAPGPNVPITPDVTTIQPTDKALRASDTSWEQSWQGFWSPISANGTQEEKPADLPAAGPSSGPTAGSSVPPAPPSTGLVAGMAAMGAAFALIGLAVIYCLIRRRRRRQVDVRTDQPADTIAQVSMVAAVHSKEAKVATYVGDMGGAKIPEVYELPQSGYHGHTLQQEVVEPAEMDASPWRR